MKVIDNLKALEQAELRNPVVALGNFDGVHLGHQKLLKQAVDRAQKLGCQAAVLTFNPHPLKVLAPARSPKLLTTLEQRLQHFAELGIDLVILLPFTRDLAELSPEQFTVEILVEKVDVSHVCVGFNYTFGKGGKGGPLELRELGRKHGFGVSVVGPKKINNVPVSSTEIRGALERGEIEQAQRLLGYWPAITGTVVKGDQRGRTIGFPTANVETPPDLLTPANGVYAAWFKVDGETYPSMVNIGFRPTFIEAAEPTIEVNIFDFEHDIYGEKVEVFFRSRLRSEQKFKNVEDLLQQLNLDQQSAYEILINDKISAYGHKKQLINI